MKDVGRNLKAFGIKSFSTRILVSSSYLRAKKLAILESVSPTKRSFPLKLAFFGIEVYQVDYPDMGFGFCFNLSILLCLSMLAAPISAEFFSDASSIPPWMNSTSSSWNEFKKLAGCHAGEKLDGLSKLKQYFQHFGYLPVSGFNFTDEFDKMFESAVRTYQKNFNLNVTGELDELTLKQVQRPRCGVADIINGSTSMNSGKPSHFKGSHFHTVSHYSFFPGTPRWPESKQDLTYAFFPDNQLSDDVKSVFVRAFSRWSAVTPLTFTATETFNLADIKIGFFTGEHGDGEPFDGVLGTLAHAFSPPSGRFHLDGDENWVISGDIRTASLSSSAIDLESVAVHEIGHLLGLGHSSVEEAIMYPTISSRTRKIELNADDIKGIQELYGSNPNGTNSLTPGTSTQERDTSGGAHSLTPWWSLCLILAVDLVLLSHMIL